jgi:hypothetical protein
MVIPSKSKRYAARDKLRRGRLDVVRRSRQDCAALSLTLAINRPSLALLPALVALSCTRINPDYCDGHTACSRGRACDMLTSTCVSPDARAEVDAPGVETAPDARPDAGDVPGTCASEDDCLHSDAGPTCFHGTCKRCQGANECKPSQFCAIDAGRCVECTETDGCLDTPASPICLQNRCAPCPDDAACARKYPTLPACDMSGACVECTEDKHCPTATKPICDVQAKRCVPCTADSQCVKKLGQDPGVCLAHLDGRCATVDETVFVQQITNCSTTVGAGGAPMMPYCLAQDGITSAVAGGKPLVVMRGPVDRWTFSSTTKPLSVVGQMGAKVVGAGVGVRVSAGDIYLRNLIVSVSGAIGTGVVAENGAILRMNRCSVINNGAGGISVNNAGFDIVNTVIAGNDGGESVPGTTFGGVYLSAAAGKPQRFLNNTIVGNKAPGLYCTGTYPVKGLLANGNAVREVFMCAPVSSNVVDPPQFDQARPYHLTASSPCVNAGDPTEFPPDDLDGDARPQMGRSDCGADEFKP